MYDVSQEYKEQMKQPIRNRSYMRIMLGLINQEAQMSAEVENQSQYTEYSDFSTLFTKNDVGNIYATYEQNFFKADGSMYFIPRDSASYRKNGLITNNFFSGTPTIKFSFGYGASDIRGLTIQFGFNYPTKFSVITDNNTEVDFENNSDFFETETVFENTSTITLKIKETSTPNNRIRLYYIKFGLGVEYDNEWIETTESSMTLSAINEELPEVNFSVTLKNDDQRFNVDNPSSEINFLETEQKMSVIYGYELNDGTVEWMQLHTLMVNEWSADDTQATIKAVDRFKYMSGNYYKGRYYEGGISLYDLAEDVLQDAGLEDTEYFIEKYLKNIVVHNPIPNVTHKEALQIIANAGRCILSIDRYGKIKIMPSFIPEHEVSSNGTVYYSDVSSINNASSKKSYATYEQNFFKANKTMYFLPREGIADTGYVSEQISGSDGTFSVNPKITYEMESTFTCYGLKIRFSDSLPASFVIKTYSSGSLIDTYEVMSYIPELYQTTHQFSEFDKMEIEFTKTASPNSRIHIDYIEFGDETDYTVEYDDLYSTPTGTQLDKVKNLNVSRQIYSSGTEDEELTSDTLNYDGQNHIYYFSDPCYGYSASVTEGAGSVSIISSGAYYVEVGFSDGDTGAEIKFSITGRKYNISESFYSISINNRGSDTTWDNPLISDLNHCKNVAEWIADYLSSGVEYELDFRGEPAIDCGDTIFQENKYVDDLKTIVEEHQMTFGTGGYVDGAIRTLRKSFQVKIEDNYENLYDGSYEAGYMSVLTVMDTPFVSIFDVPSGKYRTTGFIDVTGLSYIYSIVMSASKQKNYQAYSYVFFSDTNLGSVIGEKGSINGGTTVVGVAVPEGANYVRISQSDTSMGSGWSNGIYIGESSDPDNDRFVKMNTLIE